MMARPPHIMRQLFIGIMLALLIAFPFSDATFYVELLTKTFLLAIFAMSLDILVGFTGLVSLGHAAYFGISAYTVALLAPQYAAVNFWWSFPASIAASTLTAFLVGLFVLRTRGVYFIMVTLAFAQMFFYLFHDTALGGSADGIYLNFKPSTELFGFSVINFEETNTLYFFILGLMVLVYYLLSKVMASPLGKAWVGIRHNEHRMQSLGYDTYRYKLGAFTLAGGVAGIAGYFYAVLFGFITPELLSWHQSGDVLLMVILGGLGNLLGAILGAFAFTAMKLYFSDWTKHWSLLMGCVILLSVLFLPGGLVALPSRLKHLWTARHNTPDPHGEPHDG